ncbi:hypothetical protein [Isoptericola sp. NPDC057653]|uniref:hypothetical protein n=1 Tax=Isoptericola sp. NPDC057653 TaxID=3346195 RepID=UPI00367B9191
MRVTLVRHAAPQVSAGVDPAAWPLSPAGRAAARDLRLPAGTTWARLGLPDVVPVDLAL